MRIFTHSQPMIVFGMLLMIERWRRQMELRIPAHFDFSELQLTYNPVTDELSYNVKLLSDMLTFKANEDITLLDEPFLWGILLTLYRYHLDHGGQPDELIQQFLDALGKDTMKSHSGIEKNQSG